jgi:transcription initiation factor IIE alpha subunit
MSTPDEPIRFRNHYRCPNDATEWSDEWSCQCNDKCPTCNAEIEPYESEDI